MTTRPAFRRDDTLALAHDVPQRICEAIARRVAKWPHGIVRTYDIAGVRRPISYAEAWTRSASIAAAIERCGHPADQPVVLVIEEVGDFLAAFWACLRAGRKVVALQSAFESAIQPHGELALREVLQKLGSPLLLVDTTFAASGVIGRLSGTHRVLHLSAESDSDVAWDDAVERAAPVCLVATSGSTGTIKLVRLDEQALLYRYFSTDRPGPRAGTNNLGVFPLDSMSGLRMGFLVCDTFTHIQKHTLTTHPETILHAVDALRISGLSLTNSLAQRVLEAELLLTEPLDFSSVRSCGLGGEAIVRDTAVALDAMLARRGAPSVLFAGYGATEIGDIVAAANPLADPSRNDGSVRLGACAPGVAMRIVGDTGLVLNEGEVGEVEVAAPLKLFSGYWGEPELTQSCFTPDGWWKTGDLGELNEGIFTFRGRSKHIIVVNGRKLALAEIDTNLTAQPDIGVATHSCAYRLAEDATERLGIAFVADGVDVARVGQAITAATIRAFGIRPEPVLALSRSALPLTATGKIRLADLATLLELEYRRSESGRREPTEAHSSAEVIEVVLERIWCEVLNLQPSFDQTKTFFDLGGDSLRSATLYALIEDKLGRRVRMEAFFADPIYSRLLDLVRDDAARKPEAEVLAQTGSIWPLPDGFRSKQLAIIETWPGERVTHDRLLLGLKVGGSLPPLFCVLNAIEELDGLASSLGPEQPVYVFRSFHMVSDYAEDKVQAVALEYLHDLETVCPSGPLFLLGQCQGATIAIAMAQHLMRRGRHVPLLVLSEWSTQAIHYPGPTLLVFGRDSSQQPKHHHGEPSHAWRRFVPDHAVAEVPGSYGKLYAAENVTAFADELRSQFAKALPQAPSMVPHGACRVRLDVGEVSRRLISGQRCVVDVAIHNIGYIVVSTRTSGLLVGNYWTYDDEAVGNRVDGRTAIPDLVPCGSVHLRLEIRAPLRPGRYRLCIDVVEEGYRWLNSVGHGGIDIDVEAVPETPPRAHAATATPVRKRSLPMRLLHAVLGIAA